MTTERPTDEGDTPEPELVTIDPGATAVVRATVPTGELPQFFDRSFGVLATTMSDQSVAAAGPAFALYHGPPGDVVDLEVGFATLGEISPRGDVVAGTLPGGASLASCTTGPSTGSDLRGSDCTRGSERRVSPRDR